MKKVFYVLLAAFLCILTGCENKQNLTGDGNIEVAVTPRKKAQADRDGAAACVSRIIMQIYDANGLVYEKINSGSEIKRQDEKWVTTFPVELVQGPAYTYLFWADGGEEYYDATDLHNVTMVEPYAGSLDKRDAFSAAIEAKTAAEIFQQTITLTRPFAQLNLIATDVNEKNYNDLPKDITLTFSAPTAFNVLTKEASESKELTYNVDGFYGETTEDGLTTITMDYIFVEQAEEKDIIDITFKAGENVEKNFTNIPVQTNYRTNLIGKLFSNSGEINVIVDPIWNEEDIDIVLWDGTVSEVPEAVENVITITTPNQLAALAKAVNEGNSFSGTTIKLGADINLNNQKWTPIGNVVSYPSTTFAGIFDGNDKTISNLNVVDKTTNYAAAGLFGSITGKIKNLNLVNVYVKSSHYAGAICAYSSANAAVIENCKVQDGIVISSPELLGAEYDNGDKVGGIIGYVVGGDNVNNCIVDGLTITAYRDLGGIVGCAGAGSTITSNKVFNTNILQDNTNAYKESVNTYSEIIGRDMGANASDNIFENVTVSAIINSQEAFSAAVATASANATLILAAGTYTMVGVPQNITIKGLDGTKFNCTGSGSIASIPNGCTFDNVEMTFGQNYYHGFQHAGTINMNNCTLNGLLFSYGDMKFNKCHFVQETGEYNMWQYGMNLTFTDCVFDSKGKFINDYKEGNGARTSVYTNCIFRSSVANKAAINIKETCGSTALNSTVTIINCKAEGEFPEQSTSTDGTLYVGSAIWQVDDRLADPTNSMIKVIVDDVVKYENGLVK